MTLYRSKPSEIEAVQYGPEFRPGLVQEVAEFISGKKLDRPAELVDYVQPTATWNEDYTILIKAGKDGAQGWVPVPVGYWIVRQPGDLTDHWPVDPDYFDKKYEEAP